MACYHPLKAYRSRERNPETGKYLTTFNPTKNLVEGSHLTFPCGQCVGCRMDRAGDWATRCMHEAQLWPENSYITLTFSNEHLPPDYGVHVRDVQLFMKRLREKYAHKKIRHFACGEYGDETLRPHYHGLLFNHQFDDLKLYKILNGHPLYTSEKLHELWPYGLATIGNVTFESAGYVARYVRKKISGDKAELHYVRVHPLTGNMSKVNPEFLVQSRRPGIGYEWLEKFKSEVLSGFVIADGRKRPVPEYYIRKLEEEEAKKLKRKSKQHAQKQKANNTPERLSIREQIAQARLALLPRKLKD